MPNKSPRWEPKELTALPQDWEAKFYAMRDDRDEWIARFNKLPEIVARAEERGELRTSAGLDGEGRLQAPSSRECAPSDAKQIERVHEQPSVPNGEDSGVYAALARIAVMRDMPGAFLRAREIAKAAISVNFHFAKNC